MKVLFLGIDGVLNGYPFLLRAGGEADQKSRLETKDWDGPSSDLEQLRNRWKLNLYAINPECVERVNRIVEATGCLVVLSLTWRLTWDPEKLTEFLQSFGATFEIVDATTKVYASRGIQIQEWLDNYPGEIDRICILDDDSDMEHLMPSLVKTSLRRNGIQDPEVEEAIAMLNETT